MPSGSVNHRPSAGAARNTGQQGRRRTRDRDPLGRAAARRCGAAPAVCGDAVERASVIRELMVQLPGHHLHARGHVRLGMPWSSASSRSESPYGSGLSTTRSTTVKIATFAAIASASVRTAAVVKTGVRSQPARRLPQFLRQSVHRSCLSVRAIRRRSPRLRGPPPIARDRPRRRDRRPRAATPRTRCHAPRCRASSSRRRDRFLPSRRRSRRSARRSRRTSQR